MRARGIAGVVVMVVVLGWLARSAAADPLTLPARSRDGARLALPTRWSQDSAFVCESAQVHLVEVGKVKGDVIDLSGADMCGEPEQRAPTADSLARLDAALADGGYTALATVDQAAPKLKIDVKSRRGKTTVEVKLGKKRLGKGSIKHEAALTGATLVTGKKPYLYVRLETTVSDGTLTVSDEWLAIALKGGPAEWKVFETLEARLVREAPVGQEIAILPGPDGLTAVSADGAWSRLLAPGKVRYAAVDHRLQVVWFGVETKKGTALRLIDLRGDGDPETVVARMPDGWIAIDHGDGQSLELTDVSETMVRVHLGAKPSVSVEAISLCEGFDPPKVKAVKVKLADRKRLAALAARARPAQPVPLTAGARITASGLDPACADCGTTRQIPSSPLALVMIGYFPGGDCGPFWNTVALYDTGSGEFVDARAPSRRSTAWSDTITSFTGAWFAPSGQAWIEGGRIHRLDGGTVSLGEGLFGGGWLSGGAHVGPWSW